MSAHKAIVAKIERIIEIPNATNVQAAIILGETVIVSKGMKVGDVGILFPADLQLSEEYCKNNNLYRHSEKNIDKDKKGYFDDNGRVRVQPFMKIKSTAYFAPINSLYYAYNLNLDDIKVGDTFDEIKGYKICSKYYSEATKKAMNNVNKPKQAKKDFAPFFEKHVDSGQWKHECQLIEEGSLLSFHSKKHGTSFRTALTKVVVELPKWKRVINHLFKRPVFAEFEYKLITGSRNVTLRENKDGFHGSEQFRFDVSKQLEPYLEKGMTIYGEIVGFVNGKPIMPKHDVKALKDKRYTKKYGDTITYTYGCKEHEYKFHVYRITMLTESGKNVDMSQKQLEKWCDERNILRTTDMCEQMIYDGDLEALKAKVEALTEREDVLTEDVTDSSMVSEGVIVRIDNGNLTPKFMKSKSYAFRVMEGHCEAVDSEDAS